MAERCPSCDHDSQAHAPDGSGCLFEVKQARHMADRICPCTVDAYKRALCGANEGATGLTCRLYKGHVFDHEAKHIPRTDGTESVGYPLFVSWPYTEWDRERGIAPRNNPA